MKREVHTSITILVSVAVVVFVGGVAHALSLPNVFGDHMVLQREQPIPVWGWADPGEVIRVQLADQHRRTVADDDGTWDVELPAMKAGGPYRMVIEGRQRVEFVDVHLGEVWVCSGQSNMDWRVHQSANAEQEIASANHPKIRFFQVEKTIALEPQGDVAGTWSVCSPKTAGKYSAVGYFFARDLQEHLDVPVGMLHTAWGGTPAESWTTRETLESDPILGPIVERWDDLIRTYPDRLAKYEKDLAAWQKKAEAARKEGKEAPEKPKEPVNPEKHPHVAAGLYNAMVYPLIPYGIRGAIWYQGESNAPRAWQYRTLFPAMIQDWREAWGQGSFTFLYAQLTSFQARQPEPYDNYWAELREAQLLTLAWPNTGMAVIIDIGDADDIHPKNKQDVGRRLALIARNRAYGEELVYSGPIYRSYEIKDGTIEITFDHVGEGLRARQGDTYTEDGRLTGFAIAGEDKKFVWAEADIIGKKRIAVSSPEVEKPVALRYAWADNPECNLYNSARLPASPFRTDDWPGITRDNR